MRSRMSKAAIGAVAIALASSTAFAASSTSSNEAAGSAAMSSDMASSQSSDVPMVGGAPMYPSKTIVENASQANNLTTLVAAVKQADLVDTLSGSGPFTVFAPTNKAFSALPKSTVANLMKPASKDQLSKILTYHVVAGNLTDQQLQADLKKGKGQVSYETVEGGKITIRQGKNGRMTISDAKGDTATIQSNDVPQSNGAVYVINKVLMPS